MLNAMSKGNNENLLHPDKTEEYMMLIEGSEMTDGNLIGYIPGLRLGVKAHTREELIMSAKELIVVMREEGSIFYRDAECIKLTV